MGGELGYRFGWVALVVAVKDGGNMETNIYSACSEAFCISMGCQVRHRFILRDKRSFDLGGYMASKEKSSGKTGWLNDSTYAVRTHEKRSAA